ncbi:hypothetical protein ACF0H5_012934 [Mactra antiquata]
MKTVIYSVASLIICAPLVLMYPVEFWPYNDLEADYEVASRDTQMPFTQYVPLWMSPAETSRMSKRQSGFRAQKRATLNQLLQRLIAMYGNNEIMFSGRSSHIRFGAGGR